MSCHPKVFDESLQSLQNVSLSSLWPPMLNPYSLQLVVDSTSSVYLFASSPRSNIDEYVWVLSPRQWIQHASWRAPLQISNNRTANYILAINNQDYLYFQQTSGYKTLYITDQQGEPQWTIQLGTDNMSDPWINAVAIVRSVSDVAHIHPQIVRVRARQQWQACRCVRCSVERLLAAV